MDENIYFQNILKFIFDSKIYIQLYQSSRSLQVFFRGIKSTRAKMFELDTPPGGILSGTKLLLFSILQHILLGDK